MKVFIDTNIILDFFLAREPFDKEATTIFTLAAEKKIKIHIAAISYPQIGYFLEKFNKQHVRNRLLDLFEITEAVAVDKHTISKAVASPITDFEDALQYTCATTITDLYAFITRDNKHFKQTELLLLTPAEFLQNFNH